MDLFILILSVLMIVSIIQYFRSTRRRLWFGIGVLSSVMIALFSSQLPRPERPTAAAAESPATIAASAAVDQAALAELQAAEAAKSAQLAAEQKAAQEQAAAEAERDRKYGFRCLDFWDGSHPGIVRAVKAQLNDPDSFQHDETKVYPVNEEGRNAAFMTFRARNGFGGMVRGKALGSFDNATCDDARAEVLDQP